LIFASALSRWRDGAAMAKAKSRKRSTGGAKRKPALRPRNPFALVLRKRAGGAEASPKAYQRKAKHKRKIEVEE
jgi:hypothetical protein